MKVHTLDLNFHVPNVIASYLIDTGDEPILIETGPDSVFKELEKNLNKFNLGIGDIKKVFLSHIHLDHAGSAWRFAEKGATIYVHPVGLKHLINPEKLLASAKMIYREEMDILWGHVRPIPPERVKPAENGALLKIGDTEVRIFETKGHANHHNVYLVDGSLFTGDAGGIKIKNGPVISPTPPPDINIEEWISSINLMRQLEPEKLYPTHFGEHKDVYGYFDELVARLEGFASWGLNELRSGKTDGEIATDCDKMIRKLLHDAGTDPELIRAYELADPFWMNAGGLIRYWRKKGVG